MNGHLDRKQRWRRDWNDFLFYRNGQPEASKLWSNVGCGIVAYWMITLPPAVWKDWVASIAIASALIAPDVLRKIVAMRNGGSESLTVEKTTVKSESKP